MQFQLQLQLLHASQASPRSVAEFRCGSVAASVVAAGPT